MAQRFGIVPVSFYDLEGLEAWLQAKADAGLRPAHLGSYFYFKNGGNPGTRYCIVPKGKDHSPEPERLDEWTYALSCGGFYEVYATANPQATPLPKDMGTIAAQIKKGRKRTWVLCLVLLICFLVPLFLGNSYDVQPNSVLVVRKLVFSLSEPAFLLLLCAFVWNSLWHSRETSACLYSCGAWKPGRRKPSFPSQTAVVCSGVLQLLLIPLLLFALVSSRTERKVPLADFHQPYVALSALEALPLETYGERFGEDFVSRALEEDFAAPRHSVLASAYYEVAQQGFEQGKEQETTYSAELGEHMVYSPNLEMTRLSLWIPHLSGWVAELLMDNYRLVNLLWDDESLSYPGVDFVLFSNAQGRLYQRMAIGKDGAVAVFRYSGQEDLRTHLDVLSTMVHN